MLVFGSGLGLKANFVGLGLAMGMSGLGLALMAFALAFDALASS